MNVEDATAVRLRQLADENYFLRARVERLEHALTDTKALPAEWRLTATEAAVFAVMVNREIATREAIMAAIHRDPTKDEPLPKSVDVYVYKLRQKLGPHGVTIATEFGIGYRLAPHVRRLFRDRREAAHV